MINFVPYNEKKILAKSTINEFNIDSKSKEFTIHK